MMGSSSHVTVSRDGGRLLALTLTKRTCSAVWLKVKFGLCDYIRPIHTGDELIRPELSGRIATHTNGNSFAQFGTNAKEKTNWCSNHFSGSQANWGTNCNSAANSVWRLPDKKKCCNGSNRGRIH